MLVAVLCVVSGCGVVSLCRAVIKGRTVHVGVWCRWHPRSWHNRVTMGAKACHRIVQHLHHKFNIRFKVMFQCNCIEREGFALIDLILLLFHRHCIALDASGRVFSWGRAAFGRLGLQLSDPSVDVSKPQQIMSLSSVSHRSALCYTSTYVVCCVPCVLWGAEVYRASICG